MYRMINVSLFCDGLRTIFFLIGILSIFGCATFSKKTIDSRQYHPSKEFSVSRGEDVIGQLAYITLEKGDTLPDIARHFDLGINAVSAANPGVDVWVPKDGERIMLPLSFILPDAPRKGIVINLAAMRLFEFNGNRDSYSVYTYPVGVGTEERPSPMGQMYVDHKVPRPTWHVPTSIAKDHLKKGDPLPAAVPPGPDNPLGEYAMYLSKPSYLVHGTNKPASIGLRATNGCIRLYPEDIKKVYANTPIKTPVSMISQPYLIGQSNGVVYLEVHTPPEDQDAAEFDRMFAKLKKFEKESGRALDWTKVKKVLAEARGIPIPIFEIRPGSMNEIPKPVEIEHPNELYGKPSVPPMKSDAWSILAADTSDAVDASRLAAMINHQGPPIPARVLSRNGGYRVIAGPFSDLKEAKEALKRLKIDLDIDGRLIEPVRKSSRN
ncbi:MAG TPA: L,D-transpeptidase family protein [Dissulfurispiraceae bacterium]|nr:L,D-transpeptidase family protein [Dissulfurispiraceae bacterium]